MPAAQGADGDNKEEDPAEEHDGQGLLPSVPHAEAHGVGEESVEAHAGGLGKGDVGQHGRQEAADGRADAGGQQDAVLVHAGGREHPGVDKDDIGHGEEGGDSADDLRPQGAAPLGDLKKFVHVLPPKKEIRPALAGTLRRGLAPSMPAFYTYLSHMKRFFRSPPGILELLPKMLTYFHKIIPILPKSAPPRLFIQAGMWYTISMNLSSKRIALPLVGRGRKEELWTRG